MITLTIAEIERKKQSSDPEEQAYYRQFGWEKIVIPSTYTHMTSALTNLKDRFNRYYMYREVGSETLERWQVSLQKRMDTLIDVYERKYVLYAQYDNQMKNNIISGTSTTSSSSSRSINTPDAVLNANDNYADSLTKSGGTSSMTVNGNVVNDVNKNINGWMDIDDMLIQEFEVCFIQILE